MRKILAVYAVTTDAGTKAHNLVIEGDTLELVHVGSKEVTMKANGEFTIKIDDKSIAWKHVSESESNP